MDGGDQEAGGDPDRFRDVVVVDTTSAWLHLIRLGEDDDEARAVSRYGLSSSVPSGASASSHTRGARSSFSAAIPIRRLTAASLTTTKCHGCRLAPLGALAAVSAQWSSTARGTASSENCRTVRRRRMQVANASALRSISVSK